MPLSHSFTTAAADLSLGEQIRAFFDQGGMFMYFLAATSVVGIAAVIFKGLSLRRSCISPGALEEKIEHCDGSGGDVGWHELEQSAARDSSVLARLTQVVIGLRQRPRAEVTEAVQSVARAEIVRMQAGMAVIDVVISVAPLLGLLGTASGLVVVFSGLQSDADWLKITGGIGRALNTTIVGMAIAVPAIIAQGFFQRRIDTFAARLEVMMTQLLQAMNPSSSEDHPDKAGTAGDESR